MMTLNSADVPVIKLDDILDFAYCPLRVWWRHNQAPLDVVDPRRKHTGDELVRLSVMRAMELFLHQDVSLGQAFGVVWKSWIEGWELGGYNQALIEYARKREDLLKRFRDTGSIKKADGSPYKRPTWSQHWRDLAKSMGLDDLRKEIDSQQHKVGLGVLPIPDEELYRAPLGLADAFATAYSIIQTLKLPEKSAILGVNVPVWVDLLSARLALTADLVVDFGESKRQGRPTKSGSSSTERRLGYELHIYEEDTPTPYALARDMRVWALGQATTDIASDVASSVVSIAVDVRHMPTGITQRFNPIGSAGLSELESLSRSVLACIRAGAWVPRMVCGWKACGDCEYRRLCFADDGVMQALNPPMMAQIQRGHNIYQKASQMFQSNPGGLALVKEFLRWMVSSGQQPDQAIWLLDAIEAEIQ